MEEFSCILSYFALTGEVARAKALLQTQAAACLGSEIRRLMGAIFDLASGNSATALMELKDPSPAFAICSYFAQLQFARQQPIREQDKIDVLNQQVDVEMPNAQAQVVVLLWVVGMLFDPKAFVELVETYSHMDDTIYGCLYAAEVAGSGRSQKMEKFIGMVGDAASSPTATFGEFLRSLSEGKDRKFSIIKQRFQVLAAALHDQLTVSELEIDEKKGLFQFLNTRQPGMAIREFLKSQFSQRTQNVLVNLALANFPTISDAQIVLKDAFDEVLQKGIGKPTQISQLEAMSSYCINLLRAMPCAQIAATISEFLTEKLDSKNKVMKLLLAYVLGVQALFKKDIAIANRSIDIFNDVFSSSDVVTLGGISNFIIRTEDIYILVLAQAGRLEEARAQLNDADDDVRQFDGLEADIARSKLQNTKGLLNVLVDGICGKVDNLELLQSIASYDQLLKRRQNTGAGTQRFQIQYGFQLPDTIALALASQYLNKSLGESNILDNDLLVQAKLAYDSVYNVTLGSQSIRYARMQILNQMQLFDILLREVSDLSIFASSENNVSISTEELILAASAAASLYKHDDASGYASQALIIDPTIERTPAYARVVAKICTAKGDFAEAAKKLNAVLDQMCASGQDRSYANTNLVAIRIHIALLLIKNRNMEGFKIFTQLQEHFSSKATVLEMSENSKDYYTMHLNVERSKAILYLLRLANFLPQGEKSSFQSQSSFDLLLDEHNILFVDNQMLVDKFKDTLDTTFTQGSADVGAKYIGSQFGPNPINVQSDIFFAKQQDKIDDVCKFCQASRFTIQMAINLIKPYIQYSLDATELLSSIHLVLLNDKVGYVQCYNQLIKATPSTTRLAALASAHLAVGNAKQSQEFYQKAIESAILITKTTKLAEFVETLVIALLNVLRSRALSRCHRYAECKEVVKTLVDNCDLRPMQGQDVESKLAFDSRLIVYGVVTIEFMKLLIKLREYKELYALCDSILKRCQDQFGLPQDPSRGVAAVPLPVIYIATYSCRAIAELIKQNNIQLPISDRLAFLTKASFLVESGILPKAARAGPASKGVPSIKMCQSVFSTQQSKIECENVEGREMIGLRALTMSAEIRVELAEIYMDLAKISQATLANVGQTIGFDRKTQFQSAYDHALASVGKAKSARGLVICAMFKLVVENSLEEARAFAVQGRDIEPFNGYAAQILQVISHKMNFDENESDVESEKANTPFEDSTKVLRTGLNVDRTSALDTFLLNSCLVHDMTVVTDCLFNHDEKDEAEQATNNKVLESEFTNLQELNERQTKMISGASNLDGYYYLGRGFLSTKMGRVQAGFKDIMIAVNSQTLKDRYRARALYLLGTLYVNPTRMPLYGFTSSLQGKQQSAVALQKQAMAGMGGDNVNQINNEQVQTVDNEVVQVPDQMTINQREEDISEALQILESIEQLANRQVPEALELYHILQGFVRIGQYNLQKDKIARTLQDDKQNRVKISQLSAIMEEAKNFMQQSCETLVEQIQRIDKNDCNYVVTIYALGVIYCNLKNEAKARSSFTNGSKQIASIREIGQNQQQSQAQLWLDVDAAVQCNLALADQYVCIGKITNALRCLDGVAALDKIQTISYELYGLCMEKEASYEDAVKYYESAWLLSKGSPSVAYRLAYNYMKADKFQEAILMCQSALTEWPNFQKLRTEVLFKAEQMIRTQRTFK